MSFEALSIHLELPDLWQQEAVRVLKSGRDLVLNAPTGAGKTYVFELLVKSGVLKGRQAVYTVPTRALANDKWRDWTAKGWHTGIATGDLARDTEAPVVVATLETQRERLLCGDGPGMLVIDEYQMLGDPRRGLNYELALALAPPGTQLLLMSGSVANPEEIVEWLRRLGREVELVETRERPVPLDEVPVMALPGQPPAAVKGFWPRLAVSALMADLGPLLIFAPQRKSAEKLARQISDKLPPGPPVPLSTRQEQALGASLTSLIRNRVAYHHSGLSYAQRAGIIEPLAKAGHLRVIVATTGLAAGIDFSVRSVFVAEGSYREGAVEREIAPDELLQMFGRAGRRGRDETGYVLCTDRSPRLGDARPKRLRRSQELDWPTLLRVMHHAAERGDAAFLAAEQVSERLFSRAKIDLGLGGAQGSGQEMTTSGEGALFGLGPVRKEVRNSRGEWEREDPDAWGEGPLREVWVPSKKARSGWRPALRHGGFMEERARALGRLCRLAREDGSFEYGAEAVVGTSEPGEAIRLTKRWRSLAGISKRDGMITANALEEVITRVSSETQPGVVLHELAERNGQVLARFGFGDVEVKAYREGPGRWLVGPERRTVSLDSETTYEDEATGEPWQPATGSVALAWRKLGLVDWHGKPVRRGQIVSFFQGGEGLAIAAALEDETYPVDELVLHLANLRAGYRFEDEGTDGGKSARLTVACRQAYGPADYEGYLRLGLPPSYGEGAAEVLEQRLDGAWRRGGAGDFGEGDVERLFAEWVSLLRHLRNAPDLPWERWRELKTAAAALLKRHDRSVVDPSQLPRFDPHELSKKVSHRLTRRSWQRGQDEA